MIKHIVLWNLHDSAGNRSKQQNALQLKQMLENLNGKIPGLLLIEVGLNIKDSKSGDDDADVIMYSEFEDMAALENYYPHPEHTKIKPFAASIRRARKVINYEVN